MTSREGCRFCNRKVDLLPSGRLAYHYYMSPGIGIPCPGVPAKDVRWVCSGCTRDNVETDEHGRLHHHYIRTGVMCKGAGRFPEIAA